MQEGRLICRPGRLALGVCPFFPPPWGCQVTLGDVLCLEGPR